MTSVPMDPELQEVCNEACRIERPDETIETQTGPVQRAETFFVNRARLAELEVTYPGSSVDIGQFDPESKELLELAKGCMERIKSGDCELYVLNVSNVNPRTFGALLTYEQAENALGFNNEGE